jgi:hypothetical protein
MSSFKRPKECFRERSDAVFIIGNKKQFYKKGLLFLYLFIQSVIYSFIHNFHYAIISVYVNGVISKQLI